MQPKPMMNVLRLALTVSVAAATFALAGNAAAQATNCPGAPKSRLVVGRTANVTPGGSPNNLRDQPSKNGKILSKEHPLTGLTVLAGPTCADNYAWWQVALAYDNITTGWMAEGSGNMYFLDPTTTSITTATIPSGENSVDIKFNNAGLTYNGIFGDIVEADRVFGIKPDPTQEAPDFALYPDYIEFRFGPPPSTNPYRFPEIDVYPVDAFVKLVVQVKDLMTGLKKILTNQPANFPYDTSDA